jgi:predicted RNA-binding Zn-ribbon protein involved in translation (DUF1610 family)
MTEIQLNTLRADGGTQPRESIDPFVVEEYASAMQRGDSFPPVQVVYDGEDHWLYDGFHRLRAAKKNEAGSIAAEVQQGTRKDAVWLSLGVNSRHGKRRTRKDKRRAIKRALRMRGAQTSDRAIARHVGCSAPTVKKYREELHEDSTVKFLQSDKRTGADGRTIDTSRIGGEGVNKEKKDQKHVCPHCGKAFSEEVWHCPKCDHHWPPSVQKCKNCVSAGVVPPGTSVRKNGSIFLSENSQRGRGQAPDTVVPKKETNEYYTPPKYLDAAREVMGGIDLDPASCKEANQQVQASTFYTKKEDGLAQKWGGRVWLNPPYGGKPADFTGHLLNEYEVGRVDEAIALLNVHSVETKWFAPLWDYLLCVTDHRIDFVTKHDVSGSNHGSVFVYLGNDRKAFARAFASFGYVVEKVEVNG